MQMVGYMNFGQGSSDITASDITGFKQDNREFAVMGLVEDAAVFVDITDPANPFEVGRISGNGNQNDFGNGWRDLKYWNRHVYIGTEAQDGIRVVSVDDPDNPVLVHTITDFTSSHNIHIDAEGYLYVVGAADHYLWIYELTDHPDNPTLTGTWDGAYLHDIEVYNNKAYGAGIYTGYFYIIDVAEKTNPTTLVAHDTGSSHTHDCAVIDDENYLIIADEKRGGHVSIWDVSDYENINRLSEYIVDIDHSVHNVYVRPGTNLAIISYYVDGTRILDISDPANPVEVGLYDTSDLTGLYDGNWGTYAYLPSGYIISSDRQNGLFIFSSPLTMNNVVFDGCPIAPTTPDITSSESFIDSIKLSWDAIAEISRDSTTVGYDFEGYRLYRSLDHGETWGDEEEKIYDDDSVHMGWQPYVQFDSETGIQNNFSDTEVYPHLEYCYVLTSYDPGLMPDSIAPNGWTYENGYPSIESGYSNRVCLSPLAQDIYTPQTESLFKEDESNIGWSQITYVPNNVDTNYSSLYQFEIKAEVDSNSFQFSKIVNPKLYIYEVNEEGIVLDSLMSAFSIYSIDDDTVVVENKWIYVLGMYIKLNNHLYSLPIPVYGPALDTIIWQTGPIYSYDELLSIDFEYSTNVVTFNGRPFFDYLIEFGESGLDTATHVAPPSACADNETNTLLPFRITNRTTGKKVMLRHLDRGINGESGSNEDLGYGDCEYTRNESVKFYETDIDLSDITKEYNTYNLSFNWAVQSEEDSAIYPWSTDDSVKIITRKMLHDGDIWLVDMNLFNHPAMVIKDNGAYRETFQLSTPYPNPFNPITKIDYSLPYSAKFKLTIYDLLGRQVEILYSGIQRPNNYTITWDAGKYSSGVYLVQMTIQDIQNNDKPHFIQTKKMVLLK